MKVLLVDDDSDIRSLLRVVLESEGHEVAECSDAVAAMGECQRVVFPLIILDWELGDINGVQLCRQIRALPRGDESVILMFTVRNSPEDLQMILDAGADDYLQKPADIKWLKIRLKISASHAENKIARKTAERQLAVARAKEIDIGSRIQQNLLLGKPPVDFRSVEVFAHSIPSQKVDGDFYDFYKHNERCFDLVVGDVMGKGVAAALLGAAVKSQILHAIQELKSQTCGAPPRLRDILAFVQTKVTQQLIDLGKFVTLCYARFCLEENKAEIINCGHPRAIHYRAADRRCDLISGNNLPVGVIGDESFTETTIDFHRGDMILFYSDGLTESRSKEGEFYGEARLADFVKTNRRMPLQAFGDALYHHIQCFAEGGSSKDDRTCVAVRLCEE